jgi:D-alanyl-D-alanine endopeptidase (penicillin-binding protein 7)
LVRFLRSFSSALVLLSALSVNAGTPSGVVPLTAQSWLVADGNGKILDGKKTTDVRSIASITKLMTVMVVLDAQQDLNEVISTKLYNRKLTRRELISLAIVKSDNQAATLLCQNYTTGLTGCVHAMNDKAKSLEMNDTKYLEPTGLSIFNVSTAEDLVKLVISASKYPIINEDSNKESIKMSVGKKKTARFGNTNRLVGHGYDFIVSKTGWITKSGGCIVMMLTTERGIRTVVLLGSKNTKTRIPEAKMIALAY